MIFPHPDDEAYVSGGLLRSAEKYSVNTKLICLTKGGRGLLPKDPSLAKKLKNIRSDELKRSSEILGIDELILWDYPDGCLYENKTLWSDKLKKEIIKSKASLIVTFDPSGITGHPDHLITSKEIFDTVKSMDEKPQILFRVPDKQEKNYFKNNQVMPFALKKTHELSYPFSVSIKKIKAIFAHKSQLKNFLFKLQILEWFLFDNKEYYHLLNHKKSYPYKITAKVNS